MYIRTREGSNSTKLAGQARRKGDKMATGLYINLHPKEHSTFMNLQSQSSHDV